MFERFRKLYYENLLKRETEYKKLVKNRLTLAILISDKYNVWRYENALTWVNKRIKKHKLKLAKLLIK